MIGTVSLYRHIRNYQTPRRNLSLRVRPHVKSRQLLVMVLHLDRASMPSEPYRHKAHLRPLARLHRSHLRPVMHLDRASTPSQPNRHNANPRLLARLHRSTQS